MGSADEVASAFAWHSPFEQLSPSPHGGLQRLMHLASDKHTKPLLHEGKHAAGASALTTCVKRESALNVKRNDARSDMRSADIVQSRLGHPAP